MNKTFDLQVAPTTAIKGMLRMPGDKSISHRALLFAAFAKGSSKISGLANGADVITSKMAMQALGAGMEELADGGLLVHGFAGAPRVRVCGSTAQALDMGNSGTTTRLLAGMLAGIPDLEIDLHGDSSLSARPMRRVSEPLNAMGAMITTAEHGGLPLHISGRQLQATEVRLGVASAQLASAITLAALRSTGQSGIYVPGMVRDHSERMLRHFSCELQVQREDAGMYIKVPGEQQLCAADVQVAGDISSAAFFLVAACLVPGSDLLIAGVGINPTRVAFLDVLRRMGADIEVCNQDTVSGEPVADLRVRYSGRLKATDIAADEVPNAIDELPILLVAMASADGKSTLRDATELRHKECDRIDAMAKNLAALGVKVRQVADGMDVTGGSINGGTVHSLADHRVSMAMSVAALCGNGKVHIRGAHALMVSLPDFVALLGQVGVDSIKQLPFERTDDA